MGKGYSLKIKFLCLFFLGVFLTLSLLVCLNTVKALDENDTFNLSSQGRENQDPSILETESKYLGNALRVYSKENFLYVFEENDVLSVYDLTKPRFPELINSLSFPTSHYHHIRIEEDILYLPKQNSSLLQIRDYYDSYHEFDSFVEIYNLSDPYKIYKIGKFFVPGHTTNLFIQENQIYIQHYIDYINHTEEGYSGYHIELSNYTLTIYNATNPENVAIIKSHDLYSVYGGMVCLEDNFAIFLNYSYSYITQIFLVNFTDIYEPKLLSMITLENIREIHASGNMLFIQYSIGESYFERKGFINTYSFENPTNPILLSTIQTQETYSRIQTYHDILFIESNKMLILYNISSPDNPIYLYEIVMNNFIRDYFISDEYIIIVSSDSSITIFYFTFSNPKALINYQKALSYLGIGSIFIVIPLVHFIFERLTRRRKIEEEEDDEETQVLETENNEKPDEEVKELFVLQPAKYPFNLLRAGFILFAIQNAFMFVFVFIVFFSLFDDFKEQTWLNYLFNILFFLDLIFALIFVVALVLLYLMYKHNMALVIASLWLLWICATFAYRFFMGLPEYYPQIVLDQDYSSYYTISGLFAINVILLWLCFYFFSKYLSRLGVFHNSQIFIVFGYFNYVLGFLLTFGFIWGNEFAYGSILGIFFFVGLFFKTLFLPIFGVGLGGSTASNIQKIIQQEGNE